MTVLLPVYLLPSNTIEVYRPQSCSHVLEMEFIKTNKQKKKTTHHVAGFQNRKVSIKLCPSSVHLITKATIDATFMNKSQLIREMVSHFLIFSTILVCSLSWHVIPTSVKVTSCFLLSQTNDSGLLLCILTLVPASASCPATIALSFSLISCILGVILSVSFS